MNHIFKTVEIADACIEGKSLYEEKQHAESDKKSEREEPKEKPREYMLDARSIFKRAFEESK